MDILWEKHPYSTRELLLTLKGEKKHAYTTIATILQRLCGKGLLLRKETKEGFIYSPKLTKVEYSGKIVKSFLNNIVDNFGDVAIVSFAQSIDSLPKNKREHLLELLQKYENSK